MWKRLIFIFSMIAILAFVFSMQTQAQEDPTVKSKKMNKQNFDTWQAIKRLEIVL